MHKIPSFLSSEKPIQVVTLQKPNEIFPTSSNQLEVTMKMKRNWKLCILTEIQRNLILKFKKIIFKREKMLVLLVLLLVEKFARTMMTDVEKDIVYHLFM